MRKCLNKAFAVLISISMAMSSMQAGMTVNAMENCETTVLAENIEESEIADSIIEVETNTEKSDTEESNMEETDTEDINETDLMQEETLLETAETEESIVREGLECNVASDSLISLDVEGGSIYFDSSSGCVVSADDTVTSVTIPSTINGYIVKGIAEAAFDNCENLSTVVMADTITFVGKGAFYKCKNLSNVKLSNKLTQISEEMFYECKSLKSIDLPSGITEIGSRAFYESKLKSISLPNGLKKIGEKVFYFTEIEELILPNSVETVGKSAFFNMSNLKKAKLSSKMTEIPEYAFGQATYLKSLEIPEGITKIGDRAFISNLTLTEVELPQSIETIGFQAFLGCDSLTNISLNENLKTIGSNAFDGCCDLKEIVFPESLTKISRYAFYDCTLLSKAYFEGDAPECGDDAFECCSSNFTIYYKEGKTGWTTPEWNGYRTKVWQEGAQEDIVRYEYKDENGNVTGYIDFDKATGYVIAADQEMKEAIIPEKIDEVTVIGIETNAFRKCKKLVSVTIPDTVTDIGEAAFYECNKLSSITLPKNLTKINNEMFYRCWSLKTVDLPTGITEIGTKAFYNSGMKSIVFPEGLKVIKDYAFYDACIEELIFPDSVEEIDIFAFYSNDSLQSVKLPKKMKRISNYSFARNKRLKSVSIPEGVTVIGSCAFHADEALTEIELPESVEAIWSYAFFECTSLQKVSFGENLKTIGEETFGKCISLKKIQLPESLTTIECGAFKECVLLQEAFFEGNAPELDSDIGGEIDTFQYASDDFTIYYKESKTGWTTPEWNGYQTKIWTDEAEQDIYKYSDSTGTVGGSLYFEKKSGYVLSADTQIKSVIIPEKIDGVTVVGIGVGAFQNCKDLTSIVIPDTVKKIESGAFIGCTSLSDITLPKKLTKINSNTFNGCESLTSVQLPSTLTEISLMAFYESGIETITLPNGLKKIGEYAFAKANIVDLTLPDSVEKIDEYALAYMGELQSIELTGNLTEIPDFAFDWDMNLESVKIPEGVTRIGAHAFAYNYDLEKVELAKSVETIEEYAFRECHSLEKISIGENVKILENHVFYSCNRLYDVKLSEGLEIIESNAFYICPQLKEIVLPETLKEIKGEAFRNCEYLQKVYFKGNAPKVYGGSFKACSDGLCLYYVEGKQGWTTPEWNGYKTEIWKGAITEDHQTYEVEGGKIYFNTKNNYIVACDEGVTKAVIPTKIKNVTVLGISSDAFANNTNIAYVKIPATVTTIGVKAFDGCSALTTIVNDSKSTVTLPKFDGSDQFFWADKAFEQIEGIGKGTYKRYTALQSIKLNKTGAEIRPKTMLLLSVLSYSPEDITYTPNFKWSSSNTEVATVDNTGKVTGVSEGTAEITVQAPNATASCVVTVWEPSDEKIVVKEIEDQQYTGSALKPEIIIHHGKTRLVQGIDYAIKYKNNINVGKASAIITYRGSYKGSQTIEFNIVKADLKNVIVEDLGLAYNGKQQRKIPVLSYNGKILKQNKDYTVQFGKGNFTDVGKYEVVYTATGNNFTGTTLGTVTILDKSKLLSKAKIKLEKTTWYYTGTEIKPGVSVKMAGVELNAKDYTVSYYNNVEAGKGTVVVKGKGEYAGTKKVNFMIKRPAIKLTDEMVTVEKSMQILKGGCKPEPLVKCGENVLIKNKDYTVAYSKNKLVGTATVIVKGKGHYKGTVEKNFTITAKDLSSVHMRAQDIIYTGKAGKYMSKPVLMDDDSTALTSSDYGEITYTVGGKTLGKKDNPEAGTVITVTVTGKGNYSGKVSTTYTLREGKKINKAKVAITEQPYTGKQVRISEDNICVKYNGVTLIYGEDYEIVDFSYKNNIKKGTATVAIKGCGDYVGEKTVSFKIKAKE